MLPSTLRCGNVPATRLSSDLRFENDRCTLLTLFVQPMFGNVYASKSRIEASFASPSNPLTRLLNSPPIIDYVLQVGDISDTFVLVGQARRVVRERMGCSASTWTFSLSQVQIIIDPSASSEAPKSSSPSDSFRLSYAAIIAVVAIIGIKKKPANRRCGRHMRFRPS